MKIIRIGVVTYGGRAIRPEECKWTVTEKGCLAVVEGIKAYREYLSHWPFTVYTDHKALQWLNNMKDPSNRLGRWALKQQEYQNTVGIKEGKRTRTPTPCLEECMMTHSSLPQRKRPRRNRNRAQKCVWLPPLMKWKQQKLVGG